MGKVGRMLIAKGYDVVLFLDGGARTAAPKSYGMLHDPSGERWSELSVLIAPFKRGRETVQDPEAEDYFGYDPKKGIVQLPPKDLSTWGEVGIVEEIHYRRTGVDAADYYHVFDGSEGNVLQKLVFGSFGVRGPNLFRRGRVLRMEFQTGAEMNERGFVFP